MISDREKSMSTFVEISARTPIFSFSVSINGGTVLDPVGLEGLSRHTMELALRGSQRRTREQIDRELDRLGASLSLGCTRDTTYISGLCLSRFIGELEEIVCDLSLIHI